MTEPAGIIEWDQSGTIRIVRMSNGEEYEIGWDRSGTQQILRRREPGPKGRHPGLKPTEDR